MTASWRTFRPDDSAIPTTLHLLFLWTEIIWWRWVPGPNDLRDGSLGVVRQVDGSLLEIGSRGVHLCLYTFCICTLKSMVYKCSNIGTWRKYEFDPFSKCVAIITFVQELRYGYRVSFLRVKINPRCSFFYLDIKDAISGSRWRSNIKLIPKNCRKRPDPLLPATEFSRIRCFKSSPVSLM